MKNIIIMLSIVSLCPLSGMEQPAASQSNNQTLQITTEVAGDINKAYNTAASLMENKKLLGVIRYGLYTLQADKNQYFRAFIQAITVTGDGLFRERCSNYSLDLSRILVAYALKDLAYNHRRQIRPQFAQHQPLHIKSQYSDANQLILRDFNFEILCDNNKKPLLHQLCVSLGSETSLLEACDKQLVGIQSALTPVVIPPLRAEKDDSTSEDDEEEIPLPPAAPAISQEELRKTAISKLRAREEGKTKLPRAELEAMIKRPGYFPITGISKKKDR